MNHQQFLTYSAEVGVAGSYQANIQGVWYDPGNLSTLFQDSAFTVPVTAVEQQVGGMLDLSGRGNHASQATPSKRSVYSRRVNLLTKTEQFDDAVWVKSAATVVANAAVAPDGTTTAYKMVEDTSTSAHRVSGPNLLVSLTTYSCSVYLKAAERQFAYIRLNNAGGDIVAAVVDLSVGVATSTLAGLLSIDAVGNGWYRVTGTGTSTVTTNTVFEVRVANAGTYANYTGDGTSGIYVWGASLTLAADAHLPYQWVNTATDYDADPTKFPAYLAFDGVGTALQTGNIDFTSTDKMTVWAGVTKLSDAADGTLYMFGDQSALQSGSFRADAPGSSTVAKYQVGVRGTAASVPYTASATYNAPNTTVFTQVSDIGADIAQLRLGGVLVDSRTTDQGAGAYGNYPLYIGARAGTSLFFNGRLYSLIIRGAQSSLSQIEATEAYIKKKAKFP